MPRRPRFFRFYQLFFSILIISQVFFILPEINVSAESELKPLYAPEPGVSIGIPSRLLIGEDFNFTITFDNTSLTASDTGFGPYIDIFLPQSGADDSAGGEKEDGIVYDTVDYLGNDIRTWDGICNENATFTHPLTNLTATCPAAPAGMVTPFTWQYLIVELPFGSFVPDQPPAPVTVHALMSDYADLDTALPIYAQGGFRFGADALDNPSTDPPILGTRVMAETTPTLFILNKEYLWRESETSTGPNYPRQYRLTVDIPEDQTITDLIITDILSDHMQYLSIDSTSPAASGCTAPSSTVPGGSLSCTFDSVTGTDGNVDASITFSFYIPLYDAGGARIIPPETGGCVYSENDVSATADWDPLDPRDDTAVASDVLDPGHELEECSHTIQKFHEIETDVSPASYSPNDVIEYRHEFQVSDYFAEDDFTVIDVISDGQHFDSTFTPTLSIDGNTFTLGSAAFDGANFTVEPDYTPADPLPNTGTTTLTFYVSDEIARRNPPLGRLVGGCVPTGGTGGADPDCTLYNDGPTTGIITYRTVVLEEFTDDFPSGDESVDQGDRLYNDVDAYGGVLNNSDLSATGNTAEEDSAQSFFIEYGVLQKSIYAVRGSTTFDTPVYIAPAETITYRLTYTLNTSDVEDLSITDYLPLPVLDADEITVFDDIISSTPPAAGHVQFGPSDTFRNYSGIVPTITVDSVNNSFELFYGDFDSTLNESHVIDLLFTVTVSDDPFADELYLTNQARVYEGSTNYLESDETKIIQFELHEPFIELTKGAVASDRLDETYTPDPPAPLLFSDPGSGCPRFAGTITSADLDLNPIDSDANGLDSADLVTFAVVAENSGHSYAYDVRLRDDLPAGYAVPAGGINLCVTDGTGAALPYTDLGGGFLGSGIELNDPGLGALEPGQDPDDILNATGRNLTVITFDLELVSTVEPGDVLTNTATVFNYSGTNDGPDFTAEDLTDEAEVTVLEPEAAKIFDSSNYAHTAASEVTIGESAIYELTITFPEGLTNNAVITDNFPSGLAFAECQSVSVSSGDLTTDLPGGFPAACNDDTNPTVQNNGDLVQFTLGNVTNANTDNSVGESVTYTIRAVALNTAGNQDGTTLANRATFSWEGGSFTSPPSIVTVIEPAPTVNKTANPTTGDAGDTVTFTITITNPTSSIDAFDLTLDDIVPAEITYDTGSFVHTAGLAPDTTGEVPHLNAYWGAFPDGSSSTLQFSGELKTSVTPGDIVYNDAIVNYTSLPLAPGQQSPYNNVSYERTGNQAEPGGTNNDYTINDPATVTINVPQPIKYLVNTSETHTLNTDVAIGEIVRYRLSTIIPEGTSNAFQVRDLLPGGLLYIDDGTARLAFISNGAGITSSTITCANDTGSAGDPGSINTSLVDCTFPGGSITNQGTANPFSRGNDPWFDFGNLVNSDDDGDREYVVVEFNALVVNISGNQAGTNLSNDFLVYEGGSQIANAQNLTVRVVEPNISVNKSVSGGPYDGGDTITYTILLTNSSAGNATAGFDLAFSDVFDAALQVQSHTITPPGYATVTDISSGNTIEFGLDRLNAGDSVTISVTALIPTDTEAYLDIPNDADLTYTSLPLNNGTPSNPTGSDNTGVPGEETGERTGDDGVGGGLNDYASTDDADITIAQPAIDKQDGSPDPRTIGEETTFPIVVTLPEGTTRDLVVVDNLPVGLQYVSDTLVTTAAGSGGRLTEDYSGSALNPTVTTAGGSGDDVSFDFGDVVTTADAGAPPPDNNSFLLLITARVMDVPQNSGGDILSNTGYLQFTNPNSGGAETISDDPVTIDLIEPVMEITKTFNPDLVPVNGFSTVTITVSNTGTSPAYDVTIEDSFPTAFYQTVNESVTPGDFSFGSTLSGGSVNVTYAGGPIEAGGSREFQLQVQARGDLAGGDTHLNTATVTQATTIDGANPFERDEPDVSAQDTITIITPDLTLDKDDGQVTASPGEVLVYTLTIDNVGLQAAEGVVISDTVPDDTTFNAAGSSPGWSCTGGEGPGTLCTYTIGSLGAGGQAQVLFALQVDNPIPAGVDTIENSASVTDNGVFGADPTPANNIDNDIDNLDADPDFVVEKVDALFIDADSSGNPSAGDTLRYTISIQNNGEQDAADVVFDDIPGANTALAAGSVTTSQGTVTTGNTVGDTTVSVALGEIGGGGGSATVGFNVTIDDPLPDGTYFVENQGTLSGPDFPDEPSDDPDVPGDDDPTVTLLNGSLIKAVSSTNQGHTIGQDVAIGEIATYDVTLNVPPGSTNLSTLTDTLTEGLAFVECLSITPGSGNLTTNRVGGFSEACSNPSVSAVPFGSTDDEDQGREVQYDLGDLANSTAEAITLVIRYRAVVINSAGNLDGGQVGNSIIWDYEGGSLSAEAPPLDIVEPDMRITKSADTTSATNGDLVTFTLRVIHTGATSADAFELEMTDPLPPELVYEPGTLSYVSGQAAVVDDSDPANLRATWVDFPQAGTETVLEFQVRVTGLSAGQSTSNEAFLAWTSLPGDVSGAQSAFNTLSTERFYDPPSLVNIYGDSDTLTVRRPAPPSDPPGSTDPGPLPTPTFPASK